MPRKVKGQFKEKYNDSCIRIFKFIMLLLNDEAYYDNVIELFKSEERSEKQHVTLNKYINTLKIFGINLEKVNGKYIMKNLPFSIDFNEEDLTAIGIFECILKDIPDKETQSNISKLINSLKLRFNNETETRYSEIRVENSHIDRSFYYEDLKSQIQKCEDYISTNKKLTLKYTVKGLEKATLCVFKEIIYDNKYAYIRVFKTKEKELEDIPLMNILSIEELPVINNTPEISMTTVFRLKGRLAKAYTLKEGEYINEYCGDGSIIVVNKTEPQDKLLRRLMRYDNNCIIEHPKEMRNRMIQLINESLKKYE